MVVRDSPHTTDEEEDDAQDDEPKRKDEGEVGQVRADEAEEVVVPVVPELGEGEFGNIVLRGSGKKEHYCGISDF